jgi:hypothetical protein
MKSIRSVIVVAVALVLVIGAYDRFGTRELRHRVNQLEAERAALATYIDRLCASRRVAQVTVVAQCLDDSGTTINRLRWQEVRPDGLMGDPVMIETTGMLAYFEGFVIKFEHKLVGGGDPKRGASLVMFRRIFGDRQSPDSVPLLDRAEPVAAHENDATGKSPSLWARCWDLIDDAALRQRLGVRVAQIEAPAVPLDEGQIWQVTLDAAGGLNLTLAEPGRNFIPHWCGDNPASMASVP